MALKGLDIFKLTPKSNCKDCGCPTCMAFAMKVAQGALPLDKCPHFSPEALAKLSDATAPAMKTLKIGKDDYEHQLGGETVLFRHEKTFVSRNIFATKVTPENFDEKLPNIKLVDYERIGERMFVECLDLVYEGDVDAYVELCNKAKGLGRALILDVEDADAAAKALEVVGDTNPLLYGVKADTVDAFVELAKKYDCLLGIKAANVDEAYDVAEAIEGKDFKKLVYGCSTESIKQAFTDAVQIRRGAIKDEIRTLGYPSLVDAAALAPNDEHMQEALCALFTVKYGSIIVVDEMTYAMSLAVHGLRQNIYTDPQKPMTVDPGIYPLNGADENAPVATTVDFALTYFVVSGELERSKVPINLLITDAGGYSVLTAWAAGKLSSGSIAKYITENNIADKVKNHTLIIPGKVAVLKGELQDKLPDWKIVVAPNEATDLVKFMKQFAEA